MQSSEKIKFVVVGAGHIGKRHAEMIRRESEAELVALADIRSKEECQAESFEVPFFNSIVILMRSRIITHIIFITSNIKALDWLLLYFNFFFD